MEHFAHCIKTRQQLSLGLTEGKIVLNIVDATYKSPEMGEVVNF